MKFALASSAALSALAIAGISCAAGPVVQFSMTSPSAGAWNANGVASGNPNEYLYSGVQLGGNWAVTYDLTATDTAMQTMSILGGSISVLNTAAFAQTFSLTVMLPTVTQGTGSMTGGSISGVLTGNNNGGSFTTVEGSPVYSAFMIPAGGGAPFTLANLLPDPFAVFTDPFSIANIPGASFGNPIPNQPSPTMGDGMGFTLKFTLGAGDKVDFTTALVMNAVPTPGAMALLAVGGLTGSRRRRR